MKLGDERKIDYVKRRANEYVDNILLAQEDDAAIDEEVK